jgi:hypothetical protein
MSTRTALRGTGVVGLGAFLLLVSLPFEWVEPDVRPSDSGILALLLPLALAALGLAVIAAARSAAWPFVYTRVLGACALVGIFWTLFHEGGTVMFGALVAGIGAAMMASGSSAGLSTEAEVERRSPR